MKSQEIEKLLQETKGQWVRLVNIADVEMKADRLCIHIHGKLDYKPLRMKILRDVVRESPNGLTLHFPTFSVCMICHGIIGENTLEYNQGIPTLNCTADENYLLSLIQYGYYLAKWEGTNTSGTAYYTTPCMCRPNSKSLSRMTVVNTKTKRPTSPSTPPARYQNSKCCPRRPRLSGTGRKSKS